MGAAGLGVLGISSASGLKLTESGVFTSGSRTGVLTNSGTDTDGGDDYQFPNAADNIDLQNDGSLRNVESVDTDHLAGNGRPYAINNDLSDRTRTLVESGESTRTTKTLVDLTDGPGVVLTASISGYQIRSPSTGEYHGADITVDGVTTVVSGARSQDSDGSARSTWQIGPVKYDNSCKIEYDHSGSGNIIVAIAESI